jgi:3-hydroxy-D-aspartate aldolase
MASSSYRGPNAHLIGVPGGVARLDTPALVIDRPALERNIVRMATHCADAGLALRPHVKTHKSAAIARLQLAAGAVGLCCAKLGEAEALVAAGIGGDILITSPVVTDGAIERLAALNTGDGGGVNVIVVIDDAGIAEKLSRAAARAGRALDVLIDLDVGLHRTGIPFGGDFLALARAVRDDAHLTFRGLQAYAGHLMHVQEVDERRDKSLAAMAGLTRARDALAGEGMVCEILTGGGTGTFDIDPKARVLTDLQGGSYVFMDRQYNDVWAEGGTPPFEPALFVRTTVISRNTEGLVTTDAGFKSFATDAGSPAIHDGAPAGASYHFFGDEQGLLLMPDKETPRPPLGHAITCIPPHCDPTVNLYDHYHVVEGDTLVDIWPIEARGRSV